MKNTLLGLILGWFVAMAASAQIVLSPPPGGGGGGGSLTVEEADGTPTGSATTLQFDQADGFTVTDEGSGVFQVDLGDIAAARMATNWGTAGTSACSTSGGVLYDNGTAIVCGANFKYNGTTLSVNPGTGGGIAFGTSLYIQSNTPGNVTLYSTGPGQNGHSFRLDGVEFFRIGGSQTALFQDQTATTGITSVIVKGGQAQSTNPLLSLKTESAAAAIFEIENRGTDAAPYAKIVTSTGRMDLGNYVGLGVSGQLLRLTSNSNGICWNSLASNLNSGFDDTCLNRGAAGQLNIGTTSSNASAVVNTSGYMLNSLATIYPPSATEPVDCTASNDGSMYFDTDDQKLCICANDGTDDEWLMSDDYSHLTGHCSL